MVNIYFTLYTILKERKLNQISLLNHFSKSHDVIFLSNYVNSFKLRPGLRFYKEVWLPWRFVQNQLKAGPFLPSTRNKQAKNQNKAKKKKENKNYCYQPN